MKLDRIDLKILDLLQRDATIPLARIADRVGLSQTPCWKRIQKHEEAGVIRERVAILDPEVLGLALTAFVMIEALDHTADWRESFIEVVERFEEVRDLYRLAGRYDFLLRVVVRDMADFDRFYADLTAGVRLRSVDSFFALERMKVSTALPLAGMLA
ncbi:Lrp/AsnC family transcriptional regulator [Rhodovulum sulfidophilum]|uniref:Lrp/AsnC family transcriptional regulator n=1 Tax=Rhodovulum sulfidophilum TaxID=35806 RepID=UPI0019218BB7|nr:Lrp/AsnC family transcriptional regulator [Rhodovulum sulfidophilum]MBL3574506.1 Lrp/AsnC family transcriptional regulator [Rhodovulum sulfidophilum]MCE8432080.1 Lrp/AsnC family transcriptional regulator [Rhodovulum sulfidophilum]MCF4118181.1 Lrp/AsnC family transcriptional regulator [Rhodovulum sulfidophilum]